MSNLKLIITRHGKSIWNKENKFVGWSDIGLSSSGIMKSIELSNILINNNIVPNIIYTSALNRSIITSEHIQKNILIVSVLLFEHVKRFSVSHMQDFH